jgi:hypothetical protein
VALDFGARAQDFLKRITPLSADLAARGRTRTLALQKLHRICLAKVRTLKARVHPGHRVEEDIIGLALRIHPQRIIGFDPYLPTGCKTNNTNDL